MGALRTQSKLRQSPLSVTEARLAKVACAVFAMTPVATPAEARERVVLPFQCQIANGQPVLIPDSPTAYSVLGRHESQEVTICAPANNNSCQIVLVHRFTMVCDGAEVPWTSVVSAGPARRDGRIDSENGLFRMRVSQERSPASAGPCVGNARNEPHMLGGPLALLCARRAQMMAANYVALPFGFAPMLGLDGIFINDERPLADVVPSRRGRAAELHGQETKSKTARTATSLSAPQKTPLAAAALAAPVGVRPLPKNSAPIAATSATQHAAAKEPPRPVVLTDAPLMPPTEPHDTSKPAAALLLEQPTTSHTNGPVARTGSAGVGSLTAASNFGTTPSQVDQQARHPWDSLLTDNDQRLVVASIVTFLMAAFSLLLLGRDRRKRTPARPRDNFIVSLAGAHVARTALTRDATAATALAIGSAATPPTVAEPDAMPSSRMDAFRVLGIGAATDISMANLKEIVDALRWRWHPDLAHDGNDRAERELRIRQINVAWDVITNTTGAQLTRFEQLYTLRPGTR